MATKAEHKRHEQELAKKKARNFFLLVAEAEIGLYLRMGRELVEANDVSTAQSLCFSAIERVAQRLSKNLDFLEVKH